MTMKSRLRRLLRPSSKPTVEKEIDNTTDESSSASEDTMEFYGPDAYHDVRATLLEKVSHSAAYHVDEGIPASVAYFVYLSYAFLILMGHLRDMCAIIFRNGRFLNHNGYPSDNQKYFCGLLKSWENFFTRRLYSRIQDVFNRPIASNPGSMITVLERISYDGQKSMKVLGNLDNLETSQQKQDYLDGEHFVESHDGKAARRCLNLGSYNYLGFGDDWAETCADDVKHSLEDLPVSISSSRNEYGTTRVHRELEQTVAEFLQKEDALVLNMGFNTNATTIPALVGSGDLILSDELNHTSIVCGARASGATIRIFKHNNMKDLEKILRDSIIHGRPRTRRPWNRIMVIVEGIYSMEGEYCDLRNIRDLCKKYGAYIYLDEAHSIGAMGATGRGITEYLGVPTADIDIMMGTFTKSFGGMGGYIAGDKKTIQFLRERCAGSSYHNALSPVVCQQVITSFNVIMGKDDTNIGKQKLQNLRDNSNYFRMRLQELGLQVLGSYDSPIMPVMLYHPGKISGFSRECLKRGLAVVVVGFPAVPLLMSRTRFCISSSHTREQLDYAIEQIDEIADILKIRYANY